MGGLIFTNLGVDSPKTMEHYRVDLGEERRGLKKGKNRGTYKWIEAKARRKAKQE